MDNFFELIGGYIIIDKKIFAGDLLRTDSDFRFLIKKSNNVYKQPEIIKNDSEVKIIFDNSTDIELESNYLKKFKDLKDKYNDKINGKIIVRVVCYGTYLSTVDLN